MSIPNVPQPPPRAIAIPASMASLESVGTAVREAARSFGFGNETCFELDLAMVEAVANVVSHGEHPADEQLVLEIVPAEDRLVITLRDHGSPIPPEALARADGSVFDFDPNDISAAPEHGMGLSLIRRFADELRYESSPAGNLLTLTRYADGAKERN